MRDAAIALPGLGIVEVAFVARLSNRKKPPSKNRDQFWYVTIHVTRPEVCEKNHAQVVDGMVGPEGFEPPTKGL